MYVLVFSMMRCLRFSTPALWLLFGLICLLVPTEQRADSNEWKLCKHSGPEHIYFRYTKDLQALSDLKAIFATQTPQDNHRCQEYYLLAPKGQNEYLITEYFQVQPVQGIQYRIKDTIQLQYTSSGKLKQLHFEARAYHSSELELPPARYTHKIRYSDDDSYVSTYYYADGSIHSTYSGSGAFIHDSIESKFERAISSGDLPLVDQYLNQGADPDKPDLTGVRPFEAAVIRLEYEILLLLIKRGAQINTTPSDSSRRSALHLAIQARTYSNEQRIHRQKIIALLISSGIDLEAEDVYGRTALIYAVIENDDFAARMLLEKGADMQHTDREGKSAKDYLTAFSSRTIIQLLSDYAKKQAAEK